MPLFGPNIDKLKAKRDIAGLGEVLLYKSDRRLCNAAAEALGALGDPGAIRPLAHALMYSDDEEVRAASARSLGAIGGVGVVEILLEAATRNPYISVRQAASDAIVQVGEPAVKPLIAVLPHSWEAALVLGRLGDKRAVTPLLKVLPMQAAVTALGDLGDKRAVPPLIDILRGDDMADMAAAAKSLSQIGDARALEPLLAILADQTHEDFGRWRWAVIGALGQLGDARAVGPLIALLNDPDRVGSDYQAIFHALDSLGIPSSQWRVTDPSHPAGSPPGAAS